jgi:hypothetical protein
MEEIALPSMKMKITKIVKLQDRQLLAMAIVTMTQGILQSVILMVETVLISTTMHRTQTARWFEQDHSVMEFAMVRFQMILKVG